MEELSVQLTAVEPIRTEPPHTDTIHTDKDTVELEKMIQESTQPEPLTKVAPEAIQVEPTTAPSQPDQSTTGRVTNCYPHLSRVYCSCSCNNR